MGREVPPHVLDGIEFGSVGRQPFHDDAPGATGHVVLDQATSVDRCAIPYDGRFPGDMPLQVSRELDDLGTLDAAGVDLNFAFLAFRDQWPQA